MIKARSSFFGLFWFELLMLTLISGCQFECADWRRLILFWMVFQRVSRTTNYHWLFESSKEPSSFSIHSANSVQEMPMFSQSGTLELTGMMLLVRMKQNGTKPKKARYGRTIHSPERELGDISRRIPQSPEGATHSLRKFESTTSRSDPHYTLSIKHPTPYSLVSPRYEWPAHFLLAWTFPLWCFQVNRTSF